MTPRRHQFSFHSGWNDNNLVRIPLISNRTCSSPLLRFGVWNARPLKTKVSSLRDLMWSCSPDLLSVTESWLTSNDSITIADLTNSLEDYAFYHLPRSTRRGCYRTQKGFMFREIRLYFFLVRTFLFSYHLWRQVLRLVTVYRPPPSKKNGFTVSEELTVTFCQFLLCGDFNFTSISTQIQTPKNSLTFYFRLICHPLCELIGTTPWNWSQRCEKAVCAVKCTLTLVATVLAHFDPTASASDSFHRNKMQWLMRYHDCPCPPRLTKKMKREFEKQNMPRETRL